MCPMCEKVWTYPAVGAEPGLRHIEEQLSSFFNCEPEIDEPVCAAWGCTGGYHVVTSWHAGGRSALLRGTIVNRTKNC